MAVTSATSGTNSTSTSNTSSITGLSSNFDTFMKLLTAQLKAQDPLSPMDTKDFTNQLVQFSGVEQQIKTNDLLTSMSSLFSVNAGSMAVSYLGKTANAATDQAALVDKSASWQYEMPSNATSVSLKVFDSNNHLVKTIDGEKTAGTKTFNWNGINSSGTQLTSGTYKLVVDAKNASGEAITAKISQKGIIESVDMSGSEPLVRINGVDVKLSVISKITLS
jgi:flagellar basal-body rod modification protein FlgD